MARIVMVAMLIALVFSGSSEVEACSMRTYEFNTDPGLQVCVLGDGAKQCWFPLDEPVITEDGQYLNVRFCVLGYNLGPNGHSSLMGPIAVDATDCFPFVRINLHYMTSVPHLSIYTPESGGGARYVLEVGACYCASLLRAADMVELELHKKTEDGDSLVFTDALQCGWPAFDKFHVAYDYYTGEVGSYCEWRPGQICCLSDRYISYIEYCIESVAVCSAGPSATEGSTWGRLKSLYR